MQVAAYIRVSTKEQGARGGPERQREAIEAWAAENDVVIVSWHEDHGTSGAVPPLQRQVVVEAIQSAMKFGGDGICVAEADRWSRGGLDDTILSRAALTTEHQLSLFICEIPFTMDRFTASLVLTVYAEMARRWREQHRRRVKRGAQSAKDRGWPNGRPGRPAKPALTPEELDLCLHAADDPRGSGLERLAHQISTLRGAYGAADPRRQSEIVVRETWLRRQLAAAASKNPEIKERLVRRWPSLPRYVVDKKEGVATRA